MKFNKRKSYVRPGTNEYNAQNQNVSLLVYQEEDGNWFAFAKVYEHVGPFKSEDEAIAFSKSKMSLFEKFLTRWRQRN